MHLNRAIILLVALLSLTACGYHTAPSYSISADNQALLKTHKRNQKLSVGEFKAESNFKVYCRGRHKINLSGQQFADYIKQALIAELTEADMYAPQAENEIRGEINHIGIKMLTYGIWELETTFATKNQRINTKVYEDFEVPLLSSKKSCKKAAEKIQPLVQNLITSFINNGRFKELVSSQSID